MKEVFDLEKALAAGHISPDLFFQYSKLRQVATKTEAMGLMLSERERQALKSYEAISPLLPGVLIQYLDSQAEKPKTRKKRSLQRV